MSQHDDGIDSLTGQIKKWCKRHYNPFYGECPQCIQVEIRNAVNRISRK